MPAALSTKQEADDAETKPKPPSLKRPARSRLSALHGTGKPRRLTAEARRKLAAQSERAARRELLDEPGFSARVAKFRAASQSVVEPSLGPLLATAPRLWELRRNERERAAEAKAARMADEAAFHAAAAEVLLPDEAGGITGVERTTQLTQRDIVEAVDVRSARKAFDLRLETFGPYSIDYTRGGRHLLLAGKRGHVAVLDWAAKRLLHEWHVEDAVCDAVFLQNETLLAVAQRKFLHIYDGQGTELHCLRNYRLPLFLEFLPYHFLLAEASESARLRYLDVSTGAQIADWATHLGPATAMAQNPWNAVICLGHNRGVVSMWSPNMATPLVKLLAHRGPLRSIAVDQTGMRMATAGSDGLVKVWDVRALKPVASFRTRFASTSMSLTISQRGLLAVTGGARVEVWGKDALDRGVAAPYLRHVIPGACVQKARFCPFEDFLGVGHSLGFSSIVVPGAGEPNYDTYEASPYVTSKQRREAEVHALLDKIPAAMIALVPGQVGSVSLEPEKVRMQKRRLSDKANKPSPSAAATSSTAEEEEAAAGKKQRKKKKKKPRRCLIFDEKDKAAEDAEAAKKHPKKEVVKHIDSALDFFTKKIIF